MTATYAHMAMTSAKKWTVGKVTHHIKRGAIAPHQGIRNNGTDEVDEVEQHRRPQHSLVWAGHFAARCHAVILTRDGGQPASQNIDTHWYYLKGTHVELNKEMLTYWTHTNITFA